VAAGADVVAGSHAHLLQGDGRLGQGYVAYGLGNFAWYSPGPGATSRSGVLTLTVRPRDGSRARVVRARWRPARIEAAGLPVAVTGGGRSAFAAERAALRSCAGLT
jgi:poly-gamma-glutamate synthesis protein (capsule biosynthesis protein)